MLSSATTKIAGKPKIEVHWKKFHSEINVSAEIKVGERTQASRDLFKEVTQVNLRANTAKMATGGTNLHDQKYTNLCAYFAAISVLRHQLRRIIGDKRSGEDPTRRDKKYEGLKIKEYIERKDADEKLFEQILTVIIGCVCPRSLAVKFKDNLNQSRLSHFSENQIQVKVIF